MIGASFIGEKVATNDVVSIRKLSETITMISACPCQSWFGVKATVYYSESATTCTELVSEKADRVRTVPVSISETSKANTPILYSSMT